MRKNSLQQKRPVSYQSVRIGGCWKTALYWGTEGKPVGKVFPTYENIVKGTA